MFRFRPAPVCEAQPMPDIRERRAGSRRRVASKRRSPAPTHRERASDSGIRPRPFDLDEIERRDEDKRHKYALLKPEPFMRQRSRSTGAADGREAPINVVRGGGVRLDTRDVKFDRGDTERRSADSARPSMNEVTGDTPSLFEPMFVRIQELDIEDDRSYEPQGSQVTEHQGPHVAVDERQDVRDLHISCVRKVLKASELCNVQGANQTQTGQNEWQRMADTLSEHAFVLQVWASEAEIADMGIRSRREESVRTAELALRRLGLRSSRILGLVTKGSPRLVPLPDELKSSVVDQENSSDEENSSKLPGPDLTPSRQLAQELKGLKLQIRTLRRLTRVIREENRPDEMSRLQSHVKDVQDLFGSDESIQRHGIGEDMPGDAALKQAREHMAGSSTAIDTPSITVN